MILLKYWYKYTNNQKYVALKQKYRIDRKIEPYNKTYKWIIEDILEKINNQNKINFKHSGHLGDIVYALPVIKELSKTHTCNLLMLKYLLTMNIITIQQEM